MSRRWRLVPTSGGGATRSAVPMLIRSLRRNAEEGASSGRDGLQRSNIERHHIAGQGGVVQVDGVLLALRCDQPVKKAHEGRALGLARLVFIDDDPAVAADRGAVLAGRVDDGEIARRRTGKCL